MEPHGAHDLLAGVGLSSLHSTLNSTTQDEPERPPEGARHTRRASSIADRRALKSRRETERMTSMVKVHNVPLDKSGTHSRYLSWNMEEALVTKHFETNEVSTAKYDKFFVTFLPLFLFEMFSRVAYLYFLVQATLSWWETVSPFAGYGATAALVFVLLAAGVKAIVEDRKRHLEDYKTNNSQATVMVKSEGGGWTEEKRRWDELHVGDMVKVHDSELFPADLLCLHCGLQERICYVKTTNLDGETNLKVKRQMLDEEAYRPGWTVESLLDLKLEMECELPNSNLHSFRGKVCIHGLQTGFRRSSGRTVPVALNQMLLRGCMLKNSRYIIGLVVYAGKQTRIQRNSAAAPMKVGSFDHFLNVQVFILMLAQVVLCLVCAIFNYVWRETEGKKRYYLQFLDSTAGNPSNGFVYTLLVFTTFWILYSYLVPISLFVTLEIVKFWQGFVFINFDPHMRNADRGEGARCRNSNLNEDLGKVEYIFSDKTGTLTSNEMRLRLVAIKGQPYGDPHKMLESQTITGIEAIEYFSPQLHTSMQALMAHKERWRQMIAGAGSPRHILQLQDSLAPKAGMAGESFGSGAFEFLPYHVFDFWINLAVCHALLVDDSDGKAVYQGPSPDEVALVECAKTMGFEFVSRSATHTTINVLGTQCIYETPIVNEFSSERQRMSVVVRAPDGTVKLFAKGADTMMLKRLRKDTPKELLERTNNGLHYFSTKGLRTLIVGTRVLDAEYFEDWMRRFDAANAELGEDEDAEQKLMDEIESDLELVGVTAIEDKLQDAVPESIATLLSAGIKVWMITGDKQETAINIAISCRLFTNSDTILICNTNSTESAVERICALTNQAEAMRSAAQQAQLVVDGKTLTFIQSDPEAERNLAQLGSLCDAVVVCRASPSQKARIVNMMREHELRVAQDEHSNVVTKFIARQTKNFGGKILAIGDGANDVAMIQAADLGIGIAGKEGRQAVNNSDYAVTQFRYLVRLLLVHGQVSHYRLGRLIKYSFYKNSCFAGVLFFFQLYNGFSGQTLVDDISAAVYNVIFTSLPILFFSLLDKPCQFKTLMANPRTYNKMEGLSTWVFWKTGVLHALFDAAICFFIPFFAASPVGPNSAIDLYSVGKTILISMLGVVTMEIMIVARYWTVWFGVLGAFSYFVVYPFVIIYPMFTQAVFGSWDMAHSGIGSNIFGFPIFWVTLLTVYGTTFAIRYFERSLKWFFSPDDNMILAELEALGAEVDYNSNVEDLQTHENSDAAQASHGLDTEAPAGMATAEGWDDQTPIQPHVSGWEGGAVQVTGSWFPEAGRQQQVVEMEAVRARPGALHYAGKAAI